MVFWVREVLDKVKRVSGVDFRLDNAARRSGNPAQIIAETNSSVRHSAIRQYAMRAAEGALYSHFSLAYFFTTACELSPETSTKKWIKSIPSWTAPIPWTTLLGFFQGLSTAAPRSTNGRQQKKWPAARRQPSKVQKR